MSDEELNQEQLKQLLEQRNNELAVINSVQAGLATGLEIQAIYNLVGDQIRDIFDAQAVIIGTYDYQLETVNMHYLWEKGERYDSAEPFPFSPLNRYLIESNQPLLINKDATDAFEKFGMTTIPGTEEPKSLLFVPLTVGSVIKGHVSLQNIDKEYAYDDSDVSLLTTLSNSMSVALENARLFDESKRLFEESEQRAAELTVINDIGQALAKQLDFQAIIDLVGERISKVFNADTTFVALFDASTDLIHPKYYVDRGKRATSDPLELGTGLMSRVITANEPLLLNTREEQEIQGSIPVESPGTTEDLNESWLGVPIRVGNKVTGVLSVQSYKQYAFSESDLRLLDTIASNAGVALENARLFDETRRLLEESRQRTAELTIINGIGQALANQLDYQAIIDLVGDRIREIFEADTTYIAQVSQDSDVFFMPYYVEHGHRHDMEMYSLDEGLTSKVIKSGEALVLGTKEEWAKHGAIFVSLPGEKEDLNESYLALPILIGDQVTGVISVQRYERNAFDESDVRLLSTIAANAGVALENARLFDETNRLLEETRQRASELELINSIGQALAAQLDIQAIYDLVGDKIRDLFDAQVVIINSYDLNTQQQRHNYFFEKGQRYYPEPREISRLGKHIIDERKALLVNQNAEQRLEEIGSIRLAGEPTKSAIFMPLMLGREVRGLISIQNVDHEDVFTEADVRLLSTLASSMSVALENARLFDETNHLLAETQQRATELATINNVSQALASELDLDTLIELVGEQTRKTFDADIAYVALHNRQTNMIDFPYEYGDKLSSIRFGEGLTSRVLESGRPLLINEDLALRHEELKTKRIGVNARSYLGVPITVAGKAIGVISVQSTQEEGRFDEDDARLLSTIAANVGAAIQNAQLYQETQRRAEEMSALAEIGNEIATTLDLKPVLTRIAERARDLLQVRDIALYLLDPEDELFRAEVALGRYSEEIKASTITFGQGVTGSIAQNAVAEVVNYVEKDPRAFTIPGTPLVEDDPVHLMSAPLISRDKVVGLLTVWRRRENGLFSQSDLDFLVSLARQAAIAIEGARLYLETQRRASEMAAVAEVGRDISATLDLPTVLERIAGHALELLDADDSAVYLPAPDSNEFVATVALGPIAEELKASPVKLGEGILGDILQRGTAEVVNDSVADSRGIHIPGTPETEERLMAASLLSGKSVSGLLSIWRAGQSEPFTEADLNFLSGLARQTAIAIENARLFAEVEHQKQLAVAAREEAEAANQAKSAFLANMSHELRTPLNAIIGFTRIVKRRGTDVLPEKQIENLDKVLVSADHLLGLINTVLDISKIEAGRMDVQLSTFQIPGLLDACISTTQPLVRREVKITSELVSDLPPIYSDQDKVKQILLNLLSNAAKFTHEGQINLSAELRDKAFVKIEVADTGIGIPDEALLHIFEEFQQADTSTTREYGGTGLGLSISRHLARLLGGDLSATSRLNSGSVFTLEIPIQYGKQIVESGEESVQQGSPWSASEGGKPLVLAIDDDPDVIYMLQENLGDAGYEVVGAINGNEGLQRARELRPLAITLDIMMPQKDGWQVLHELKADPATRTIPVILLTIVDKQALGYQLGAADYLVKPLDADAVLQALDNLTQTNGGLRLRRLLVVDDDPQIIDMVGQLLENSSFEVEGAADGLAALESISRNRPDVILLDMMMPRLDGFGVLDELSQDSDLREIPVIVLTAKTLSQEEEARLQESVNQVIEKKGLEGERLIDELQLALKAPGS